MCKKFAAFAVLSLAIAALTTGCGSKNIDLKGTVKLDGSPVEGATVVFVAEDGQTTYSGMSDGGGNFTLRGTDGKSGVSPGTYKVTVTKKPKFEGDATPGSADYIKQMEKEKAKSGPPKGVKGPGGMMMPKAGPTGPGITSELPVIYATVTATPLSVKVPPETEPVVLDLKSKP